MDTGLVAIYVKQIHGQAAEGMRAAEAMAESMESGSPRFWDELNRFVVCTGNVSKAMWGSGRGKEQTALARTALRDALGVDDGSPIRSVNLRNDIEHIDERIETWWKKRGADWFIDRKHWHPSFALSMNETFRVRAGSRVWFQGVEYDLAPMVLELDRVREAARVYIDGLR